MPGSLPLLARLTAMAAAAEPATLHASGEVLAAIEAGLDSARIDESAAGSAACAVLRELHRRGWQVVPAAR